MEMATAGGSVNTATSTAERKESSASRVPATPMPSHMLMRSSMGKRGGEVGGATAGGSVNTAPSTAERKESSASRVPATPMPSHMLMRSSMVKRGGDGSMLNTVGGMPRAARKIGIRPKLRMASARR